MDKLTAEESAAVTILIHNDRKTWTELRHMMFQLDNLDTSEILLKLIKEERKIAALKLYKTAKGCSIAEAREKVNELAANMEQGTSRENLKLDVSNMKKKSPKCYNCEVGTITDTKDGLCTDCQMLKMNGGMVVTKPKPQEEDTPW